MTTNRQRTYEELKADIASLSIDEVRATPSWRKFEIVGELTTALRNSIKDKLKARYPRAADEELRKRFAIVWLGPALAKEAFGFEVEEDDSDLLVA